MVNLTLLDVKVRVTHSKKQAHFWDGVTFKNGYPIPICGGYALYPRDVSFFMTSREMKEVPFCEKCLSMIER